MICLYCLEEYEFIYFERRADGLGFFGVFDCGCPEPSRFTEFECLYLGLLSPEELEQLKTLKLIALRNMLEQGKKPLSAYLEALSAHDRRLRAYLMEFQDSYVNRL